MNFLEERIKKDGIVREGNVLKVDSFLNHQMDIELFNEMGKEWKKRFADKNINIESIKKLSEATENAWQAILRKDTVAWGRYTTSCFEAQLEMFPSMLTPAVKSAIEQYRHVASGWKLTGAGGGGYLCLISDKEIPNAIQIRIRR